MDATQPDAAGQHYEELGFTFCKLGTICLIALAPAYALLGAAALAIFFYVRALQHGVSRSDCILRHPLVIIAFWLEAWLTKQEILSRYLSSVYFGDGVYGLRAAAHHYFGRDPENLNLAQSAMLAGMVQAPSRLAPTQHLLAAQKRSRLVLHAMADTGAISPLRERSTALARPVIRSARYPTGTYFADWVAPSAAHAFETDFGQVRVQTTLDRTLQRFAERAVARASIGDAQAAF